MNEYLFELIQKYRSKGVLVDTNLLLLFIVGSLNPQLIPQISRTSKYSIKDFQLVESFIEYFGVRVTTPHILAETSNLIGRSKGMHNALGSFIRIVVEEHTSAASIVDETFFPEFGITDTAMLAISSGKYLVLTDDGPIYGFLLNHGVEAISLSTLRKII